MSAHSYLESNQLVPMTKGFLRDLVREKPRDPYHYLLGQLRSRGSASIGDSSISVLQQQLAEMKDAVSKTACVAQTIPPKLDLATSLPGSCGTEIPRPVPQKSPRPAPQKSVPRIARAEEFPGLGAPSLDSPRTG